MTLGELQAKHPAADQETYDEARAAALLADALAELVYAMRRRAGLTQVELAGRMGASQSSIARIEGGGTKRPSNNYGTDASTGVPRAKVITRRTGTSGPQATGFRRYGADSAEDALWSAATNPDDPYGYAIFDVDPGERPGETTITMQFFAIPRCSRSPASPHRADRR